MVYRAIIDAAMHAMSIIIIGIGDADFGAMEVLDADRTGLRADGKTAARDIVQFVPFNVHKGNPTALASEVLKELPNQLCNYMMCGSNFISCQTAPISFFS